MITNPKGEIVPRGMAGAIDSFDIREVVER